MSPTPDRPFESWSLEEVVALADAESVNAMPGSSRRLLGPWRKLADAIQAANVTTGGWAAAQSCSITSSRW
jgi:hypothetical protein